MIKRELAISTVNTRKSVETFNIRPIRLARLYGENIRFQFPLTALKEILLQSGKIADIPSIGVPPTRMECTSSDPHEFPSNAGGARN